MFFVLEVFAAGPTTIAVALLLTEPFVHLVLKTHLISAIFAFETDFLDPEELELSLMHELDLLCELLFSLLSFCFVHFFPVHLIDEEIRVEVVILLAGFV